MESKVRMLRWIAVIAICAPLVVMIVALVVEWFVLDCNPNPYGQELCAGSIDFANAMMIAEYGGLVVFRTLCQELHSLTQRTSHHGNIQL